MNVTEILKNYPKGTKLYSTLFGDCKYLGYKLDGRIKVGFSDELSTWLTSEGKAYDSGEVVLFPSKTMRTWVPLTWGKGLVLQWHSKYVTFDHFEEGFEKFVGKNLYDTESGLDIKEVTIPFEGWGPSTQYEPYLKHLDKTRFKPFDKVLVRDSENNTWRPAFYSFYRDDFHVMTSGCAYKYCVPYEGNEDKVLTTKRAL